MVNRDRPHVFILPEDAANSDVANGFVRSVDFGRAVQILPPSRGWSKALDAVRNEHVPDLRRFPDRHLVVLVDFDRSTDRRQEFDAVVPRELADRLFVVGAWTEVEGLRRSLREGGPLKPNTLEGIGVLLAEDCRSGQDGTWGDELLLHNASDVARMRHALRPILFTA